MGERTKSRMTLRFWPVHLKGRWLGRKSRTEWQACDMVTAVRDPWRDEEKALGYAQGHVVIIYKEEHHKTDLIGS